MSDLQTWLSVCLGIGLSAACGFRVFVPLLCLSIASATGQVHLIDSFAWIGSTPALILFSVATAFEIAAYYIPFLDNMLDTVAVPAAAIAGVLVTFSVLTDMPPMWRWTLAMIAGGGIASSTQLATTKLRAISSVTTAGVGNPLIATAEAGTASLLSFVAILWPVLAVVMVVAVVAGCWFLVVFLGKRLVKLIRTKTPASPIVASPG
jgi:hypothetical protein